MDYKQTLEYLYNSLPVFEQDGFSAYKPGLDRTIAFNKHLDSPDRYLQIIHIAGTNGKGSVSHILASILSNAGYRVGLFTSPHLKDFRERIKVDGEQISESDVVRFVKANRQKMEELKLSFFEMTVCMAFDHFRENDVEVAVVETGLGGRLDSTNIVKPILSIITNIGLDHMALLGDTIEKIAGEKAGIIKPEIPVLIGETDPFSSEVFTNKAEQTKSKIRFADRLISCVEAECIGDYNVIRMERIEDQSRQTIEIDLLGDYQKKNVATVLSAIDLLNSDTNLSISRRAVLNGTKNAAKETGLHGRWEVLGHEPLMVCDTGHNEHGLKVVCRQLQRQKYETLYIVFGMVKDKDISKVLTVLPPSAKYIFTQATTDRAMPAEELASLAKAAGLNGVVVPNVKDAVAYARNEASIEDMIFIGGSTFVVAEI